MSMPDSMSVVEQFKNTLSLMHQTMMQMQPIVQRQLEVISAQRLIANIMFLICFLTALAALLFSLKAAQGVKNFWCVKIKRRWLFLLIGVWCISLFLFNIIPGAILMNMDNEVSNVSASYSKYRLFGNNNNQKEVLDVKKH